MFTPINPGPGSQLRWIWVRVAYFGLLVCSCLAGRTRLIGSGSSSPHRFTRLNPPFCTHPCLEQRVNMSLRNSMSVHHHATAADACSSSYSAVPRPLSARWQHAAGSARMPPLSAAAVNRLMSQQELVESLDLPPPPPPLKPVPIIHTTAYLQQTQQLMVSSVGLDVLRMDTF